MSRSMCTRYRNRSSTGSISSHELLAFDACEKVSAPQVHHASRRTRGLAIAEFDMTAREQLWIFVPLAFRISGTSCYAKVEESNRPTTAENQSLEPVDDEG